MHFLGKMSLMIMLRVTKKSGFYPLSRKYSFGNIVRGEGVQVYPRAFLGLVLCLFFVLLWIKTNLTKCEIASIGVFKLV